MLFLRLSLAKSVLRSHCSLSVFPSLETRCLRCATTREIASFDFFLLFFKRRSEKQQHLLSLRELRKNNQKNGMIENQALV